MDNVILVALVAAVAGLFVGWVGDRLLRRNARSGAQEEAGRILDTARSDAERTRRDAALEGRETAVKIREEWEREETRRREELERAEVEEN